MANNGQIWRSAHAYQIWFCALLIVLSFPISQAQGEIYRWTDAQGSIHFGDRPPVEAKTEKIDIRVNTYESVEIKYNPDWSRESDKRRQGTDQVVMYSAQWCGVCKTAKAYFKENNIPFQELDIDKSEKARKDFEKLKGRGVPIILLGDKRMNGFSPKRFADMYASTR